MTGQYPRRRESNAEAKKRVDDLERRRKEREGFPLPIAWKLLQPTISARGLEYPALALKVRGLS